MESWATTCPDCGSSKITTIQLPRPHEASEQPSTRRAFRCLGCDTQWGDEEQWEQARSSGSGSSGSGSSSAGQDG